MKTPRAGAVNRAKILDRVDASESAGEPRSSRRSQGERRQEAMTQIMDTAEALFAEKGYNGVTLNGLAHEAGVDAALMRYYFGDKEQLFHAVFRRRAPELNQLRLQAMTAYRESAGKNLQLEGVIDASVRPMYELAAKDQGWRNYMSIVAQLNSTRGPMYTLWGETFHYVTRELILDIRRIYPNVAEEEIYWSYLFFSGALMFSHSGTQRIDVLSGGLISSSNSMAVLERLPIAMAAAIRAICERPEAARRSRGRTSRATRAAAD